VPATGQSVAREYPLLQRWQLELARDPLGFGAASLLLQSAFEREPRDEVSGEVTLLPDFPGVQSRSVRSRPAKVHSERFHAVRQHVEHAKAEVIRVVPVQHDAPAPVRRSVAGGIRAVEEHPASLDVAVQHQSGGRVEGVGEIAPTGRSGPAEDELALLRRSFVGPAQRHAVGGDDEGSVPSVPRCLRHLPRSQLVRAR